MSNYLLIGSPNVGKTTIFNSLTSSLETVGNYSGVTVEKKIGKLNNHQGSVYDLPGVYSIVPSSLDEGVTTKVLVEETYSGVINVCDVSSLQRHLHLTIQLLEFSSPTALILNFYDEFEKSSRNIDEETLSSRLGISVIKSVATKKVHSDKIINAVNSNTRNKFLIDYGVLEDYIEKIKDLIPHNKLKRRFIAIALLEGNTQIEEYIKQFSSASEVMKLVEECNAKLLAEGLFKSSRVAIFEARREFIENLLKECNYSKTTATTIENTSTNKFDRVLTNPVTGIPIFVILLLTIYYLTFNLLGQPISDFLANFFDTTLRDIFVSFFDLIGLQGMLQGLLIDGVYAGTTAVLVFLPQVVILFLFLTTLESVGYLARTSLLFDSVLTKVGLNGKSIIPLITGLGCNVPAIMGTRVIDSKKERLITILTIPFMSCSARIPIYLIFSSAFFGKYAFVAMLFLQFFGVFVVLLVSKILNSSLFKNEKSYLVLEIPPYRKPQLNYIYKVTMNKGKSFLVTVTKFVALGTVIVWALSSFNFSGYNIDPNDSFLASISGIIAPLFAPLGFGTWEAVSSLISGFMAKELVVGSMSVIYNADSTSLTEVLQQNFTTASAISFVIFNALYVPCIATVGAIKKETGSWKWTGVSVLLSLTVAYLISLFVYLIAIFIF